MTQTRHFSGGSTAYQCHYINTYCGRSKMSDSDSQNGDGEVVSDLSNVSGCRVLLAGSLEIFLLFHPAAGRGDKVQGRCRDLQQWVTAGHANMAAK